MTPEGKVKAKVKALLKTYGDKVWVYMPVPTGYGRKTVDFIICVNGWFVTIETKAGRKEPTKLQGLCLEEIRKAGGMAFVVKEADLNHSLEDLRLVLDSFVYRTLTVESD